MRTALPKLIITGKDFNGIAEVLSPEQFSIVYEEMGTSLFTIIKTAHDFNIIMQCSPQPQRTMIFEAMMQINLPSLSITTSNFTLVVQYLTAEQCKIVCDSIQNAIPNIIATPYDLKSILKDLRPELYPVIFAEIMRTDCLKNIIKSHTDLKFVLQYLNAEQAKTFCEAIKKFLSTLIITDDELCDILESSTPEVCVIICRALESSSPRIIDTADDLNKVLSYISADRCKVVCDVMQKSLLNIIKQVSDLPLVLRYLPPEKCTPVFDALKEAIPRILNVGQNVAYLLENIASGQRPAVFDAIQTSLPQIIHSVEDLKYVLCNLDAPQCVIVCNSISTRLPGILGSARDFAYILQELNGNVKRASVFNLMAASLPGMIRTAQDFEWALRHLTPNQSTIICRDLQESLPDIIKTNQDIALCKPEALTIDEFKHIMNMLRGIKLIQEKAHQFANKHPEAQQVAISLNQRLAEEMKRFDWQDINTLNIQSCRTAILDAKPVLSKHRGCKQVLFDILTVLSGIGLIAATIQYVATKGQRFFFHVKTDSECRMAQVQKSMDHLVAINQM